MNHKAIVLGASGLIGSQLVSLLEEHPYYKEVLVIVRRPLSNSHAKVEQLIVDFDRVSEYASVITGDVIFSCLGTTRNKTPGREQYKRVDMDIPLEIAKIGLKNNVKQFHVITSLGANVNSSSTYLKLKGEVEEELKKLRYSSLHIYRPSYITGNRTESRIDDKFMKPLMRLIDPLLVGSFSRYRSIQSEILAKAMLNQSLKDIKGIITYPSNQIKELA